jgi:hypothetical protein
VLHEASLERDKEAHCLQKRVVAQGKRGSRDLNEVASLFWSTLSHLPKSSVGHRNDIHSHYRLVLIPGSLL